MISCHRSPLLLTHPLFPLSFALSLPYIPSFAPSLFPTLLLCSLTLPCPPLSFLPFPSLLSPSSLFPTLLLCSFTFPYIPPSLPPLLPLVLLLYLSSTELCSRVAFEPLTKHLTCGTDCTAENVSVVWTFDKVVAPVANATFRYGSPHEIHGSSIKYESVEVLADGRLRIGTVKEASHKGDYSCTAQFSNGTVCGMTDSFSLRVTQLCELFSLRL